jgi:hypothetical protein
MRHKNLVSSVLLLIGAGLSGLQAQQATPATGGIALGSGGSASYTVGQVVYTAQTSSDGTIIQGVQQPFEIFVISGIEQAKDMSLEYMVYPNPATNSVTLLVEYYNTENLQYQLYDINGKLLDSKKLMDKETIISLESLEPSAYFLKVTDGAREIKVFKIIKK